MNVLYRIIEREKRKNGWGGSINKKFKCKLYTYKNKTYKILKEDFTMKCPETRKWAKAIMYEQIESGLVFVREKEEFFKLFEKL